MSDSVDSITPLPPGWEARYDVRTRKHYYIDNYNRTTTWDDPRPRYRSLLQQSCQASPSHSSVGQGEIISIQHGSLEFRGYNTVYPSYASYPPPPQPAFQLPPTPFSHLPPSSTLYQELGCGSSRPSPIMTRSIGKLMGTSAFQHRLHHSSTDASLTPNTDELVAKIAATFPTVSETHIRCLLKKYHNREAVVMSALQVEKYPITTPGPYSTPPSVRSMHTSGYYTPMQMTPPLSIRGTPPTGSTMATPPTNIRGNIATPPLGIRGSPPTRGSSPVPQPSSSASSYYGSLRFGDYKQSPRPHSSPKMKLRYLKGIFPKVEETLLLDILATEDNNVAKATDKLKALGFVKRDTPPPRLTLRKKEQEETLPVKKLEPERERIEIQKPTPLPRMKTYEEKNRMQARLQGLYSEIPERLIQIAMESTDYDEEKARYLLMLQTYEEKENKPETTKGLAGSENADGGPSKKTCDADMGSSSGQTVLKNDVSPDNSDVSHHDSDVSSHDSDVSPLDSDVSPHDSDVSPHDSDASPRDSDVSPRGGSNKMRKTKNDILKISRGTSTTEDQEFKSPYVQKPDGRNILLTKGPDDQLLLPDYVTWNGPNPKLRVGPNKALAKGPDKSLLTKNRVVPKGPNKDLRKGPVLGLAKGSIYSQMTARGAAREFRGQ